MPDLSESSLTILSRGRGRPKAEEPSMSVSMWVPARDYERLRLLAKAREQSVSSLVRDLLAQNIPTK